MITDVARLKEAIKNYEANLDGWSPEISTIIKIIDHENKKPVISKEVAVFLELEDVTSKPAEKRLYSIFRLLGQTECICDNDSSKLSAILAILGDEWEVEKEEKYKVGDYVTKGKSIFLIYENFLVGKWVKTKELCTEDMSFSSASIVAGSIERHATQEEINLFKAAEMYADHGRSYGDLRKGDIVKNLRMPDSYAEILTSEKYIDLVQEDIDKGYVKLLMTKEEFERACEK